MQNGDGFSETEWWSDGAVVEDWNEAERVMEGSRRMRWGNILLDGESASIAYGELELTDMLEGELLDVERHGDGASEGGERSTNSANNNFRQSATALRSGCDAQEETR